MSSTRQSIHPHLALVTLIAGAFVGSSPLGAQGIGGRLPFEDAATRIDQKLGASIAADAVFRDASGERVEVADYLGGRPLILNLQYFSCPTLCGRVLNGLIEVLGSIDLVPAEDFTVLSVSFDHRENS